MSVFIDLSASRLTSIAHDTVGEQKRGFVA
jgi:hypothetical protein